MNAIAASTLPIGLLLVPVFSTLLGGWLALRARLYLPLLTALGAGLLLGTAFLDLLPEALELTQTTGQPPRFVLAAALGAFLIFLSLDSVLDQISRARDHASHRKTLGRVSSAFLVLHSFRDGMAIGAAYTASRPLGMLVACGIVAHDLGDGMNTVLLSTGGAKPQRWDYTFLLADALAPLLGGLLTVWWVQSPGNTVVLLAVAAGFFLQMATSDFLPALRERGGMQWTVVPMVLLGVGLIYSANLLLSGFVK